MTIQVGRWGKSLAIRLPKALTDEFGIREGAELDDKILQAAFAAAADEARRQRRLAALEEIRKHPITLPPDWTFDREEANWRPAMDRW